MTLEEFRKVVETNKRPNVWRYVWGDYYTPDYTNTADPEYFLKWFHQELTKAGAFNKKEEADETDLPETGEPEQAVVQDEQTSDENIEPEQTDVQEPDETDTAD